VNVIVDRLRERRRGLPNSLPRTLAARRAGAPGPINGGTAAGEISVRLRIGLWRACLTKAHHLGMKPFRFGVSVRSAESRTEFAPRARQIEDLGFSTLLIPDHLLACLPPFVPLMSAADATTTLRVGTFVINNDFRHPVLLAREAAALDMLSGGRLELGLGAGHMQSEYTEAGIPYDPASVRVERLAEAVTIVKGLLAGEAVTFKGQHYQVTGHQAFPPAVQQPRPPILIGGNGLKLLSLAAREAEIVGFAGLRHRKGGTEVDISGFQAAAVDERVAWVRSEAGARFDDLELNVLTQRAIVTDDREQAAAELSAQWPALSPEDVLETPFVLMGTVEQIVETLQARRERWGFSYYVIWDTHAEEMAPVVARLNGR
jgi:probable F420-dependent oxidoreductase